jgi:hypothetical protein
MPENKAPITLIAFAGFFLVPYSIRKSTVCERERQDRRKFKKQQKQQDGRDRGQRLGSSSDGMPPEISVTMPGGENCVLRRSYSSDDLSREFEKGKM